MCAVVDGQSKELAKYHAQRMYEEDVRCGLVKDENTTKGGDRD